MRILIHADARTPVPPSKYGGTERITHLLCDGLSARGNTVDLLAASGSQTYSGRLYNHAQATNHKASRIFRKSWFQLLSLWAARKADVVITFGRVDYMYALRKINKPVIFRLGNPVDQDQIDSIEKMGCSNAAIIGISEDQFSGVDCHLPLSIVYNSVPTNQLKFQQEPSAPPYLAFLGRLTKNKGVHIAIEAAKATGFHLKIAGNLPAGEDGAADYFSDHIAPHLNDQIQWIGPVDDHAKQKLLGGAKAMLFPIQWREPFGIVMPEALACGCPVIAWKNGSVPEVIDDGKTGYIVDSLEGMINTIHRIDEIDRAHCRAEAERRFSADTMVSQYLQVIQSLAGKTP